MKAIKGLKVVQPLFHFEAIKNSGFLEFISFVNTGKLVWIDSEICIEHGAVTIRLDIINILVFFCCTDVKAEFGESLQLIDKFQSINISKTIKYRSKARSVRSVQQKPLDNRKCLNLKLITAFRFMDNHCHTNPSNCYANTTVKN